MLPRRQSSGLRVLSARTIERGPATPFVQSDDRASWNPRNVFCSAGLRFFRGRTTAEAFLTDSVNVLSVAGRLSSRNDFGFVLGAGATCVIAERIFVGAKGTLVIGETASAHGTPRKTWT